VSVLLGEPSDLRQLVEFSLATQLGSMLVSQLLGDGVVAHQYFRNLGRSRWGERRLERAVSAWEVASSRHLRVTHGPPMRSVPPPGSGPPMRSVLLLRRRGCGPVDLGPRTNSCT
jgi:hypothetical protein